jgi:hypothetical protein
MPWEQPICLGNGGRGRSSGEAGPPEAAPPAPASVEVVGSSDWLAPRGLTSVPRYKNSVLGLEVEGGGGGNKRMLSERASFVEVERWRRRRRRWTSRSESKRARREMESKGSRIVGRRLREGGTERGSVGRADMVPGKVGWEETEARGAGGGGGAGKEGKKGKVVKGVVVVGVGVGRELEGYFGKEGEGGWVGGKTGGIEVESPVRGGAGRWWWPRRTLR